MAVSFIPALEVHYHDAVLLKSDGLSVSFKVKKIILLLLEKSDQQAYKGPFFSNQIRMASSPKCQKGIADIMD